MIRKFFKVQFLLTIRFRQLSHNNRLRTCRQLTSNTRTFSRMNKVRNRNSIFTVRISIRSLLNLNFVRQTYNRHRFLTNRNRTSQDITFNRRKRTLSNTSRVLLISSHVGQMFIDMRTIRHKRFTISRLQNKCTSNILGTRRQQVLQVRVRSSILVLIRKANRVTRRYTTRRYNNISIQIFQHPNRTQAQRTRSINKTRSRLITLRLRAGTNRCQAILLTKGNSKHLNSNLYRNLNIRLPRFNKGRQRVQVFIVQRRLRNRNKLTQHSNRYKSIDK